MPEIAMTDDDHRDDQSEESISGRSAALYFSHDPSIAQLLVAFGINVRDFILVSFLSDQGPLSIDQLARIMNIEPRDILRSVKRLAAAGLIVREPISSDPHFSPKVWLTSRGQDVATRIDKQL